MDFKALVAIASNLLKDSGKNVVHTMNSSTNESRDPLGFIKYPR